MKTDQCVHRDGAAVQTAVVCEISTASNKIKGKLIGQCSTSPSTGQVHS